MIVVSTVFIVCVVLVSELYYVVAAFVESEVWLTVDLDVDLSVVYDIAVSLDSYIFVVSEPGEVVKLVTVDSVVYLFEVVSVFISLVVSWKFDEVAVESEFVLKDVDTDVGLVFRLDVWVLVCWLFSVVVTRVVDWLLDIVVFVEKIDVLVEFCVLGVIMV